MDALLIVLGGLLEAASFWVYRSPLREVANLFRWDRKRIKAK